MGSWICRICPLNSLRPAIHRHILPMEPRSFVEAEANFGSWMPAMETLFVPSLSVIMEACRYFRPMARKSLLRFLELEGRQVSGEWMPPVGSRFPWHPPPTKTIVRLGRLMEIGLPINQLRLM